MIAEAKPVGFKRVLPGSSIDWAYAGPILIGVVLTLAAGEVLLLVSRKKA